MKIEKLLEACRTVELTRAEYGALRQSLNEVCNCLKIDRFDHRIGTTLEATGALLNTMPGRSELTVGFGFPGFIVTQISDTAVKLELSEATLSIFRNALYESCNHIGLYEFSTRMGIQMDLAIEMIRTMGRANF